MAQRQTPDGPAARGKAPPAGECRRRRLSRRRGLDRALFQKLSEGDWIDAHDNLALIGPAGVGKSWLACAIGQKACRDNRSVLYHRWPKLCEDLALARGDGRHPRLIKSLGRADLLILDDFGLEPLDASARHDLLEISRSDTAVGRRSSPPSSPCLPGIRSIGDPTYADAILDRLVHNAHRIELTGESLRRTEGNTPKRLDPKPGKGKKLPRPISAVAPGGIISLQGGRHHPGIPGRNHPVTDGRLCRNWQAAIGDVGRFEQSQKLVSHLGLNPSVRQSGPGPAYHGRITKKGRGHARGMLVEAAWAAARAPGPLRAFFLRVRARGGQHVAAFATARKLAVLIWHLLSKGERYVWARPALHARKLRDLELKAGYKTARGQRGVAHAYNIKSHRDQERRWVEQAETLRLRLESAWSQAGTHGHRNRGATMKAARQGLRLAPCSSPRGHPYARGK